MADIIVTTESRIPVSSEPNAENAGKSWYATDTKNFYMADASGKLHLTPWVNATIALERTAPKDTKS
jgi:hypothetical protein